MRRKIWKGILLLAVLAVTVICLINVRASAASHSHPICGSYCRCASSDHDSFTWQEWDGTTKMYNGYYYLTKDVVLSKTIVLDYSYTSYLCLNGHSITCEDTVFDIYSYRSLLITDCKGTGRIESTGSECTIGNNKNLTIWGGTILNSCTGASFASAINAYANTNTTICGGRVECEDADTIYAYPGCKIQVMGGTVHGGGQNGSAISGHGMDNYCGKIKLSGGRITQDQKWDNVLDIQDGSFVMTGGYVDGDVSVYDEEGTTTVSGGTINGQLDTCSGSISITGGDMQLYLSAYGNPATVSGGTFRGDCTLWGPNITVTGGDFSQCSLVQVPDEVWICGGSYSTVQALSKPLYLSGIPEIASLRIYKPSTVSAQNKDGTASFGGEPIPVELYYPYDSYQWKDGDIVIKNVKSDAVAEKFKLVGDDAQWMYLERSGNNLVLRIIPHGTWSSNATWGLKDGVLTISGYGTLQETYSGRVYPWGPYADQIKTIVVEDGIINIPRYVFEYCEQVTTIILPKTLSSLSLHAFQDCGSLNNLLLPASLTQLNGTSNTGNPSFIRCESLTDLYYLGTEQSWASVGNSSRITSADSNMTIHFLQMQESTATCTAPGKQAYYQFDDTSVYDGKYDAAYQPIITLQTVPALGHDYIDHEAKAPTATSVGWETYQTCSRCDHSTYQEIPATSIAYGTCGDNLTWVLDTEGVLTISGNGPMYDYSSDAISPAVINQPWKNVAESVKSVVFESGVTNIGSGAFAYCDSLVDVTIGDSITTIGDYAFYYCESLTGVTIGDSVTSIGVSAFYNCNKLTSVTIPNSITAIRDHAFAFCASLADVYYDGAKAQWDQIAIGTNNERFVNAAIHFAVHTHEYPDTPSVMIPATCTADGYVEYTCVCGETNRVILPQIDHSYTGSETVVAPTCTEEGYTLVACVQCGDVTKKDVVPALGHKGVICSEVVATCTQPGLTAGAVCENCQTVLIEQTVIPALGHETVPLSAVAATCTESGLTEGAYCSRCQITLTEQTEVPATGHSYVDDVCEHCGELQYMPGDLSGDGEINTLDGLMLLHYLNGWDVDVVFVGAMDVTRDGIVNTLDGLILMHYLNGWDVTLG